MSEQKPLIYGIIHIGSSNLSLRIVEYKNVNEVRVIESVRKDTNFGEEVFNHKNLSFASIRKLCRMLNGLKQLLSDYQVKVYAAYATAVFREADNCRAILDLIRVKTGFNVQVVDMPQEIYFKHFGLSYQLKQYNRQANERLGKNFLFVDITSGCVGLTVWEKGSLCYQHNVHIGTLRLLETFTTNQRESRYFPEGWRSISMRSWSRSGYRSESMTSIRSFSRDARRGSSRCSCTMTLTDWISRR